MCTKLVFVVLTFLSPTLLWADDFQIDRKVENAWTQEKEGNFFLTSVGQVIQINCLEGWDGPRHFYKKELVFWGQSQELLGMTSEHLTERMSQLKMTATTRRLEFKSSDVCFNFSDRCRFEKGDKTHLIVNEGKRKIESWTCVPRSIPGLTSPPPASSGTHGAK